MMVAGLIGRASPALGHLAPSILFAMAFCETLVVIGLFVPVTPLLVAIGAAIAAGTLDTAVLAWPIAGTALGNLVSYALGRALKAKNCSLPRLPTRAAARAQRLFERHGAAAIVLARYLGPPATVGPFLAGWSGLSWSKFLLANLVASLTWPPAMALVGYAGAVGWRWMSAS